MTLIDRQEVNFSRENKTNEFKNKTHNSSINIPIPGKLNIHTKSERAKGKKRNTLYESISRELKRKNNKQDLLPSLILLPSHHPHHV